MVCGPARLRKVLSFINFAAREINCKIVYYGAGLGGKTTKLQVIYQKTAEQQKGKMIPLATESERAPIVAVFELAAGPLRAINAPTQNYTSTLTLHPHALRKV